MTHLTEAIATLTARLYREDMDARNVVGGEATSFTDLRQLSQQSGSSDVADEVTHLVGDASGVLVTLPDGRQLRVTVEEV